jgi:hypothetical protein
MKKKNNILAIVNPTLALEWHLTKNGDLTPYDVTCGMVKKVWWLCSKGHEWKSTILGRSHGKGCPYCSGSKVCVDNCLATLNPKLAKEWHPTKNGDLTPFDVVIGSHRKVWWQCKLGHEWMAAIRERNRGDGCPYCSNRRACIDNCLATINPELALEWHPTLNNNFTSFDFTIGSHKEIWWACKVNKNHNWKTSIRNRLLGYGCPYCAGLSLCIDNCLAILNPELAKEWHPTKNGKLTPYDVTPSSCRVVWWRCKRGHEWSSAVNQRCYGHNCPYCSGNKVCIENCLYTVNPALASEWHPTKNGKLTPYDVTYKSGKIVWWKCKNGHEYCATISHRSNGSGCPYCSGNKACIDNCLATLNPRLASEWHPTKNGILTPYDVTYGSSRSVWWYCKKCGRSWKANINIRNSQKTGCPWCNGIVLAGDILCSSIVEAYMYLEYKTKGFKFYHNRLYDKRLGKYRYDFYLINENKYVEITSFSKEDNYSMHQYISYLRKIVEKKRFVENVLGAKFEFIQFLPSIEQIIFVRKHQK